MARLDAMNANERPEPVLAGQQTQVRVDAKGAAPQPKAGMSVKRVGGPGMFKMKPLPVSSPTKRVGLPFPFLIVWIVALLLAAFATWATFFELSEVSTGVGKVIPSSREQIIQSLEGGILVELKVKEGDPRWPGQIPPPVATPNSPRQDGRIMTTRA